MPDQSKTTTDHSGKRLGQYHLLRRLGSGAMAEVYLAEQRSLGRRVAVKILRGDLARDAVSVQRLRNEAMAAAALVHANIVQIYEVGRVGSVYFIAQEYVAGENLAERIRRTGPLEPGPAIRILRQIAAALAKAVEHGIVHRDIKPENILLSESGEVKVADFGLARRGGEGVALTREGVTMGTPLYMSPEQIEGQALDCRSDLYSLGVTCYHMLAGRPPHLADTALAVAMLHLNAAPRQLAELRPELPSGLCRMVHKMFNKRPEDRYQTPWELLDVLRAEYRVGVAEGWAAEVDDWNSGGIPARSTGRLEATQQLARWMKPEGRAKGGRSLRRTLLTAAVIGCLVGAFLASAARRRSRREIAAPVPARSTAWGQLYHAKMTDTPRAWDAVWKYFPQDIYAGNLARQGLVRHYLTNGQYEAALRYTRNLANLGEADGRFRAFGLASQCIALMLLGEKKEAMGTFDQLTPEMIDDLDERTRRSLYEVVSRHRAGMEGRSRRVFDQLRHEDDRAPSSRGEES
ncbi:MAG: serine/threonine-protein kinase [Pirellulales bacterium]